MTIVSASHLSASDLRTLGNNLLPTVIHDKLSLRAVNRSLSLHDESVERLYRRSGSSRAERLRSRS